MMSATKPMTDRYPNPELADLPTDIRDKILGVQEKAGFVPNVFLTLARRPEEFRAFFAYHDAVMERAESRLTKGEREMIVTATSALNSCFSMVGRDLVGNNVALFPNSQHRTVSDHAVKAGIER